MSNQPVIKYVKGDLFDYFEDGSCDAIAHCCNCQGVMGSGIALSIKNKYPDAYKAYKAYEKSDGVLRLGTISVASINSKLILNLHAQDNYGIGARFVNYEAMYVALVQARERMAQDNLKTIGVPYKMGCDRAGGDWHIVEAMLQSVFVSNGYNVLVVEYAPKK